MKSYDLMISNGHLIIKLADGYYVIDTGSPFSMSDNLQFIFLDKQIIANPIFANMVNLKAMSQFIGVDLTGIIGCDLIRDTCCTFDLKTNQLLLSEISIAGNYSDFLITDMNYLQELPFIEIGFNGKIVNSFIDTGATISYFRRSYFEGKPSLRVENDTHPMYGDFTTNIYQTEITIESHQFEIEVGTLPDVMDMMFNMINADAVIGYDLLKNKITIMDFIGRKFYIEKD